MVENVKNKLSGINKPFVFSPKALSLRALPFQAVLQHMAGLSDWV